MIIFIFLGMNSFLMFSSVKIHKLILIDNLTYEYNEKVKILDITKDEDNGYLNTEKLGENEYIGEKYRIVYTVKDTTPPLILGSSTKSTTVGNDINLTESFLCGDNYDDEPIKKIEGTNL